jgi:hypothetical protein
MRYYIPFLIFVVSLAAFESCSKKSSVAPPPPGYISKAQFFYNVDGFYDVTVNSHRDTTINMPVSIAVRTMGSVALTADTIPPGVIISPSGIGFQFPPATFDTSFSFHIRIDSVGSFPVIFRLHASTPVYDQFYRFHITAQ